MDHSTYFLLHQLLADYWLRVDGLLRAPVGELFTSDGTLRLGRAVSTGRAAIDSFYEERRRSNALTKRNTRHVNSQLHVSTLDEHSFEVRSTVQVFVGEGSVPYASKPAASIVDFLDIVKRDAEGLQFASRNADVIFAGEGLASFLK